MRIPGGYKSSHPDQIGVFLCMRPEVYAALIKATASAGGFIRDADTRRVQILSPRPNRCFFVHEADGCTYTNFGL